MSNNKLQYSNLSILELEAEQSKIDYMICCKIISEMILAFKKLKKNHPSLMNCYFGMGSWGFSGKFSFRIFDGDLNKWVESQRELYHYELKESDFEFEEGDYDSNEDWRGRTDGLFELVRLAEDIQTRYMTTYFEYIDGNGVHFKRQRNIKSPFGHPPISDLEESFFYKQLQAQGTPSFIHEIKE